MLHHNELISIEEDTILGNRQTLRRFTLINRVNGLKVSILTSGGTLCSVGLDQHEVISNAAREADLHQSGSEFQSHVLGMDSLMLSSPSGSLTYLLTSDNDLVICGKLRQLYALSPFYFNLVSLEHSSVPTT